VLVLLLLVGVLILLIIDDPHSEQDAMNAQMRLERAYEWYIVRSSSASAAWRSNRRGYDKME
jgi:hypothetical protein